MTQVLAEQENVLAPLRNADVLLMGTATHLPGSRLPDVPAVPRTLADLADALVRCCGADLDRIEILADPENNSQVGDVLQATAERAQDVLLVSFVGHGLLTERGDLHLATRQSGTGKRHEYTAWPYDYLRQFVLDSPAQVKIVILDCCFSGRAVGSLGEAQEIAELTEIAGAFVLTSAGRDELALAPVDAGHTAFMGALINLLAQGDPAGPELLTLNHAYRYLSRVLTAAGCPRPRRKLTGLAGDLVIAANPAYRSAPDSPARTIGRMSPMVADVCPYPGLSPFSEADSALFFGRARVVSDLVRRLADNYDDAGPLLLTGASGAGKTSLLRAGLLPAVARGELKIAGSAGWPRVLLTPSADPLASLSSGLAEVCGVPAPELAARLADEPAATWREIGAVVSSDAATPARVVLVVDQLEEIFTGCPDRERRQLFIRAINAAGPAALVVLGMRADFLGRCADHPELAQALARPVVVGPMTAEEVRTAIERPAAVAGLDMEPGLTDLLLKDLGARNGDETYEAGRLPLLSHVLRAVWHRREGRMLTADSYMGTGGIGGALARTADRVLDRLDESARAHARPLFLRLVHVGEGTVDTRRRVPREQLLAELPQAEPEIQRLLNCFAADDARLITVDDGHVEITHESLVHAWPTLRGWLETDRAAILVEQQILEAARQWHGDKRDSGDLYRGTRLALIREWAGKAERLDRLGPIARAFLDASIEHDAAERIAVRRRGRLRVAAVSALAVLLVAAVALAGAAEHQRRGADEQREIAEAGLMTGKAAQLFQSDPVTAMRLSLAAHAIASTRDTRSVLLGSAVQPEISVFTPVITDYPAYSGDGSTEAVVTAGGIQIWDITTRRLRRTLPGAGENIAEIMLSHDGTLLAANFSEVEKDPHAVIWNTTTGRTIAALSAMVRLTASSDHAVIVGDGQNEQLVRLPDLVPVPGLPASLWRVQTDPSGSVAAVTLRNGASDLYRITPTTTRITQLGRRPSGEPDETNENESSLVGPGGRWILTTGYEPRLLDTTGAHKPRTLTLASGSSEVSAALSQDGRVVVTTNGWAVQLWDTETMRELRRFSYPGFAIKAVGLTHGDDHLVLGGIDGTARILDVRSFTHPTMLRTRTGAPAGPMTGGLFSPDGHTVATVAKDAVRFYDRRTGVQVGADVRGPWEMKWDTINPTAVMVPALSFSPDGATLAVVRSNQVVSLIDVARTTERARITVSRREPGFDEVLALAFDPRGEVLAVSDRDSHLRLWDVRRMTQVVFPTDMVMTTLVWSPDGNRLALSHPAMTTLWDRASAHGPSGQDGEGLALESSSEALAFSPDGRRLVVRGENDCACAGQVAPDIDARVWVWDTVTRKPVKPPLVGHTAPVVAATFSHDGSMIATTSTDDTVRIWDAATHSLIGAPLTAHAADVVAVSFSSDDRTLRTLGADGRLHEQNVTAQDAVRTICERVERGLSEQEWRDHFGPGVAYRATC